MIKQAKVLVSIDGFVNNAAIFELQEGENLDTLIKYASGMTPDASKINIKIDRFNNNIMNQTFDISYSEAKNFKMQNGDKVYIYPLDFSAKSSVNIYGNIIRPGNYQLGETKTLNELLKENMKFGVKKFFLPQTYFEYAVIKRYSENLTYTVESFDLEKVLNASEQISLKPQDEIFIFNQNDIASSAYITTVGSSLMKHGKLQFFNGMSIKDAINASGVNGVIDDKIRLTTFNTDDYMPATKFISLENESNTTLSPYDEIEVYDYYNSHILEPVSISGEVVKPTSVYYEKGMTLKTLLEVAGNFNKKAYTKSVTITRYYVDDTLTRGQKTIKVDLETTPLDKIILEPYDEVKVGTILGWNAQDYATVSIRGEVNDPVTIKYGQNMSIADLITSSGGLTQKAFTNRLEIVRYTIDDQLSRKRDVITIDMTEKSLSEIPLSPYDEVTIFKIPKWGEKKSVIVKGQVKFPGTYAIEDGERVASVLKRAGGFTDTAFVEGTVFTRERIKQNQIEQYNSSLSKIKRELAIYNAMPANSKQSASMGQAVNALSEVMDEAKRYQPIGRINIVIDQNLTKTKESLYNIVLKDQDTITIPSSIDTVTVFGEVYNPSSFVYDGEKDFTDYVKLASGYSKAADIDNVYVIHANGTSEPINLAWYEENPTIGKGDTIIVPIYIKEFNQLEIWDSASKILSNFAITAAAFNTLGITK